jgi:hypothetical protein
MTFTVEAPVTAVARDRERDIRPDLARLTDAATVAETTTGGGTIRGTEADARVRLTLKLAAAALTADPARRHWPTVAEMELTRYVFQPRLRELELMTYPRPKRPKRPRRNPRPTRRQSDWRSWKHGRERRSSKARNKRR